MVKDLEDQPELKISEIDRLNEQQINKSSDTLNDEYKSPNSKVHMYVH